MEKFSEAAEYAWNCSKRKLAEAIIKLAASFDEPHDVWDGQEVDEEVEGGYGL